MLDRLTAALADRYRLEGEAGAGGMATVYLADDLKHDRKVAIKVLRPELAAVVGADRFLSEIRTTANLQHPHILPLFDSGEADGFLYYVMPYVAGETLRDRLDREKQLPVDEAVAIARKVGSALDYAHKKGVIHRDIKPANILMEDGEPQVADFGIALAVQQAGAGRLTETGLSLGTPYYMSPEQATGDREPDPRSDLYSLGCVAYEMLAGEPPFTGATAQSVLAKILTDDAPAVTRVRKSVPLNVASAVARATQRLPADRFATVGEFNSALVDDGYRWGDLAAEGAAGAAGASGGRRAWQTATVILAVATVALAALVLRPNGPSDVVPLTLRVNMPDSQRVMNPVDFASADLSDDGSTMVYVGPEFPLGTQLWVKRRGDVNATPLRGTSSPGLFTISPDGSEVAFVLMTGPQMLVMSTQGGTGRVVADSAQLLGADWGQDGNIYFQNFQAEISRVPSVGGSTVRLGQQVQGRATGDGDLAWPQVLPGGKKLLVTRWGNTPDSDSIAILDIESQAVRTITRGVNAQFLPPGHLVVGTNDRNVSVAPFDPETGEITGPPRTVFGGVRALQSGALDFRGSASGTLLHVSGGGNRARPVWVDREGVTTQIQEDWTENFLAVSLSPDGSRIATAAATGARADVWVRPSGPGDIPPQRLTFGEPDVSRPVWSVSGDTVIYVGTSEGASSAQLLARRWDGTGELDVFLDVDQLGSNWAVQQLALSPDGQRVVYRIGGGVGTRDIYVYQFGVDTVGRPLIAEAFNEHSPAISPDGRYLAYGSNESGQDEVYVRTFPDLSGGKWLVSSNGGREPVWAADGSELFYKDREGFLFAASWSSDRGGVVSREPLFDTRAFYADPVNAAYAAHPDGRLIMLELAENPETGVVWMENFVAGLAQRSVGS